MEEQEYKKFIQQIAANILPVLFYIDSLNDQFRIEDLNEITLRLRDDCSFLDAWPFPETMRKAEVMNGRTKTFVALVKLMEARKEQLEIDKKPDTTPGQDVLQTLGFM
jgi:hypothetical protein